MMQGPASTSVLEFAGRFTNSDGLRGWAQARGRKQPYYGQGSIDVTPEALILRGWQRTWLGVAEAVEAAFSFANVRNAAVSDTCARFEVRIGRHWRTVEFALADATTARTLVSALPETRTPGFDEQ